MAIDELVAYMSELSGINSTQGKRLNEAVNQQFKEIKNVIPMALDVDQGEDFDEETLRKSIMDQQKLAMERTDSKKFGPSEFVLMLQSEFEDICTLWETKLDE